MENCCATRPNFGRPVCVEDFGAITSIIIQPFDPTNGWLLSSFGYNNIYAQLFGDAESRLYPFPQMENVEYQIADSLKEEGASGRKSFLRNGVITLTAETWDKDATAVIKGKMAELRCQESQILFVTDKNMIIGSYVNGSFKAIKIDSQSVDPKFMFKTNTTTQKVMLTFDLDRNFDDSTYYAISGDELWDTVSESVKYLDFNNLPAVIDAKLSLNGSVLNTGWNITVNDDYRQGDINTNTSELGNVLGLGASNFLITNLTDATTVTPTSVGEQTDGDYAFVVPSQTSGDKIKVELVVDADNDINYDGSITFLIP